MCADGYGTGVAFLALRFIFTGNVLIQLLNPLKLLRVTASLVQKLAGVVVYIDPGVRLFIAVCQVSCLVEGFAVFPERSAWPCESVDWIQSYYPILTFRGLCLHGSPQTGDSFTYPNASTKASIKSEGAGLLRFPVQNIFLLFAFSMFPSK